MWENKNILHYIILYIILLENDLNGVFFTIVNAFNVINTTTTNNTTTINNNSLTVTTI